MTKTYRNGRVPDSALSKIPGGRLRQGAPARSWLAMRYFLGKKYGCWIEPTGAMSSYRSFFQQQLLWQRYVNGTGALAARPGSSNHGSGVPGRAAVDVPSARMQELIRKHGHEFGWGIAGGKGYTDAPSEPWHCVHTSTRMTWKARYWFAKRRAGRRK